MILERCSVLISGQQLWLQREVKPFISRFLGQWRQRHAVINMVRVLRSTAVDHATGDATLVTEAQRSEEKLNSSESEELSRSAGGGASHQVERLGLR